MKVEDTNPSRDLEQTQNLDAPVLPKVADPAHKPKFYPWGLVRIGSFLVVLGGVLFLPSLLSLTNCTSKAKQAEAKANISSINRGQQANFSEKKIFTNSLANLGIDIKTQTENYNYSIQTTKTAAFHYAIAQKQDIKSYVGAVFILPATTKSQPKTVDIICETLRLATTPTAPSLVQGIPSCGAGTKQLK